MTRTIGLLLLITCVSCMEMRETVERMVMVRTTGSDLQPAATGFIYKKNNDGQASVIQMDESEIMEQLTKLYEKPEAYAAPIPAATGPFHSKEDESKAAIASSETNIKPVREDTDEGQNFASVDGIANDESRKQASKAASEFGDYNSDFADYLHSLGYFKDGVYQEQGGGTEHDAKGFHAHGDKGHKAYGAKNKYEKGGAGDYHNEKHEIYSISGKGGHKKSYGDADHYKSDDQHKYGDAKSKEVDGIHKLFDGFEYKEGDGYFDGETGTGDFGKFAHGYGYFGPKTGADEASSGEERHDEDGDEPSGNHSNEAEEGKSGDGAESRQHTRFFGIKEKQDGGKSFSYQVKHR